MRPLCTSLLPLWVLGTTLLLPSCGDAERPPSEQTSYVAVPSVRPAPPRTTMDSASYVFDIPSLIGLTADQIKTKLGKPLSDEQGSINDQMKTLIYQRRGYKLFIDYEVRSRRLLKFYLESPHPTTEYQYLLDAANVTQHDKRYKVEPSDPGDGLYRDIYITAGPERVVDSSGNWVPVEQAQ